MKQLFRAAILVAILVLFLGGPALAGDYITDAAQALKSAYVYVAPGTAGTDRDTVNTLQAMLKEDDKIVLVMLPAEAVTGTDIYTMVHSLSTELDNKYIIGLAVGNEVIGYDTFLPVGVASDQMKRAESVSNDPVTALRTFAQNIHLWQAANPKLWEQVIDIKPNVQDLPKSGEETSKKGFNPLPIIGMVAGLVIAASAIIMRYQISKKAEKTRFKAPEKVDDLLYKINRMRLQVYDERLRKTIHQLCLDIERYFKSSSSDKKKDSLFFNERLKEVTAVLEKYIEVQENPRYYSDPENILRMGRESLTEFSDYVLQSIRRGNDAALIDFRVSKDILEAQRYR